MGRQLSERELRRLSREVAGRSRDKDRARRQRKLAGQASNPGRLGKTYSKRPEACASGAGLEVKIPSMAEEELQELNALLGSATFDATPAAIPDPLARQQLLDLADAPGLPLDLSSFDWFEPFPGIKLAVLKEDPARGLRACLAWGKAGSHTARHRHGGDELIYVLEGVLRDERGSYGPGAVCHSRTGDVHREEVVEDCLCYVIYYGELEMLEGVS